MDLKFRTKPFAHQRTTTELILSKKNAAVLNDQGTGKTKCVIDAADNMTDFAGRKLRVLIVCPKTVIDTWCDEVLKHSRHYVDDVFKVPNGRQKRVDWSLQTAPGIYVCNYETVRSLRQEPGKKTVAPYHLALQQWDFVVADEASRMKHRGSQLSKSMHDFSRLCKGKRVISTGTPNSDDPLSVFSIYQFLDPSIFGTNWWKFQSRYAVIEKKFRGSEKSFNEVVGYKNVDELREKMMSIGVRFRREDCLDLPERVFQRRLVEWSPAQKRLYREMAEDMLTELKGKTIDANGALAKTMRLRQICQGFVYGDKDPDSPNDRPIHWIQKVSPKLAALEELLDEISGAVVVFAEFRADLVQLKDFFRDKGIGFCLIDADTDNVGDQVRRFQSPVGPRVILCQTTVAQFGLTLTRASTAIYFSNDWALEKRLQSQDRIHRIGQGAKHVTYIDLCMKGSIDLSISMALEQKKALAARVTDGVMSDLLAGKGLIQ